jgi:hypothetical protein
MANKRFYYKNYGNVDLCLVCGYVGENKCSVFYRDDKLNIIKDYGILEEKSAFDLYAKLKDFEKMLENGEKNGNR